MAPEFHRWIAEPLVIKAFLDEEPERFADASPLDHIRPDAPPFLVIHGDNDTLAPVEDARAFVAELSAVSTLAGRLRRAPRGPARLRRVPLAADAAHGSGGRAVPLSSCTSATPARHPVRADRLPTTLGPAAPDEPGQLDRAASIAGRRRRTRAGAGLDPTGIDRTLTESSRLPDETADETPSRAWPVGPG